MSHVRTVCARVPSIALVALSLVFAAVAAAGGGLRVPSVFSDHMVLQREMPVPVWGWGEPGAEVIVRIDAGESRARVGDDGRWQVSLPSMTAGGPHTMTIASGDQEVELADVLVGEVWVCSGQSNMEWGMRWIEDSERHIAEADHPRMRFFWVPHGATGRPRDDVASEWRVCSPESVSDPKYYSTGMSAVGYFFGREILREVDVPVGLIDVSWGGSAIDAWIPPEGWNAIPALSTIAERVATTPARYRDAMATAVAAIEDWIPDAKTALDTGADVPAPPAWPTPDLDNYRGPTGMYFAMIHPVVPYAVRGAIWYQGESNRGDGMLYCEKMRALIHGWRTVWGREPFPFYYVQLAPFAYADDAPHFLPEIWEAQTAALDVPNTGMAVTVDIGQVDNIHPPNKLDVGLRLARWALARTYGRGEIVVSGPLYREMKVEPGGNVRLLFDHVADGLRTSDGQPLSFFRVAGDDRVFREATAEVAGGTVVVHSDAVAEPVAVRFAWHQEAVPNFVNSEGLPASPFRTDRWPEDTVGTAPGTDEDVDPAADDEPDEDVEVVEKVAPGEDVERGAAADQAGDGGSVEDVEQDTDTGKVGDAG